MKNIYWLIRCFLALMVTAGIATLAGCLAFVVIYTLVHLIR